MTQSSTGTIPLGFGKFVRADEIVALVPIDGPERGNGLRTYVHTDTLPEPLVASRSEKAILADMERALTASETPQRRRLSAAASQPSNVGCKPPKLMARAPGLSAQEPSIEKVDVPSGISFSEYGECRLPAGARPRGNGPEQHEQVLGCGRRGLLAAV